MREKRCMKDGERISMRYRKNVYEIVLERFYLIKEVSANFHYSDLKWNNSYNRKWWGQIIVAICTTGKKQDIYWNWNFFFAQKHFNFSYNLLYLLCLSELTLLLSPAYSLYTPLFFILSPYSLYSPFNLYALLVNYIDVGTPSHISP